MKADPIEKTPLGQARFVIDVAIDEIQDAWGKWQVGCDWDGFELTLEPDAESLGFVLIVDYAFGEPLADAESIINALGDELRRHGVCRVECRRTMQTSSPVPDEEVQS